MYYHDIHAIPQNHYPVIYADPPWSYNDTMAGHSFSLDHEYPTLSLKDIMALPVSSIAAKDAALFLWVTNPQLPLAFDVMKAWGFTFKTVAFVWRKMMASGKEAVNLGRWTMGGTEMCLLATKGTPQRLVKNIRQLVTAERREHSRKPDEVRHRIEQLMGGPYIELFSRGQAEGWDAWGNEPQDLA
jgi:N6-adenosine-specific RNA methylase IME4